MASATIDRRGAVLAKGVLVTVHDLYGGMLPLLPLETYLHAVRGYDVQSFRYQPRKQDLATSGKELAAFLKRQKPHSTDEAVNFVTHGYGALVLREAFRSVDWDYTKSKVVMLAPPNRGIRYHKSMKKYVGVAELDERLGKLPRRCYPLHNYPNDGLVMVKETEMPGEFRHQVIGAPHFLLPSHPVTVELTQSFLES
eukprot:jgi/Phyca11/555484/estExt2_Genewise1Plus.C_PHYCAscaffold_730151